MCSDYMQNLRRQALEVARKSAKKHNKNCFCMLTAYGWKIHWKNISAYSQPCFEIYPSGTVSERTKSAQYNTGPDEADVVTINYK